MGLIPEIKEKIYEFLRIYNNCCYINEIYTIIINQESPMIKPQKSDFIRIDIIFLLSVIISGILFLINLFFHQKYNYNKEIAIARVPSEKYKIARIYNEIQFIEDDIKNLNFSIFRIGSRRDRIIFLTRYYVKFCINDYNEIKEILKNESLFPYSTSILLKCAIRIPHTIIFKYSIENVMKNYNLSTIYVGVIYERFALIIDGLAKKYGKKIICFPHGIVSTEKMPGGEFIGDIFYCSSMEMASKLNNLYGTSKFKFDDDITKQMYRFTRSAEAINMRKVVFFTQPINDIRIKEIMNTIAQHLKTKNQKLYIKVHPYDDSSNYMINNSEFIDDLGEAIIGSLCISLYSTVLFEAIYNESTPVSIILLINDTAELKYEFLNDQRILKPKDKTSLLKTIDNYLSY